MKVGLIALLASLGLAICLPLAAMAGEVDTDGDTIPDSADNCPTVANAGQADAGDGDGIGDACDNCLTTATTQGAGVQECDRDSDGYGGNCDCDFDNDGSCGFGDFGVMSFPAFPQPAAALPSADMDCEGTIGFADFGLLSFPGFPQGLKDSSGVACADPLVAGACPSPPGPGGLAP